MKEENKEGKVKSYIYYIIILVAVLIISAVSVTYAYVSLLNNEDNEANTSITGKTDCIDIQLDSNGSATGLTYNYPITDDFATTGENVKPITITLTNKCTEIMSSDGIDYTVALTTLSKTDANYIPDTDIKIKATSTSGTSDVISTSLLSNVTKISNGKSTYNLLNEKFTDTSSVTNGYTVNNHYVIGTGKLASSASVTYKVYLWIDYNEGSEDDKATQGENFASVLSAVINNPETFTE